MSDALRVLLVEDSPGDARLLREALAEVSSASFLSVPSVPGGKQGPVTPDRSSQAPNSPACHSPIPAESPPHDGITIHHVTRLDQALRFLREASADLVLLDLSLPDSHGFDTFARLSEEAPDVPIVVLTGLHDEELALHTVQAGAQDYLVKGEFDGRLLMRAMRYAVEREHATRALREKSEQLKLSVREAHHRIKNNLQAISDLLYLELTASNGRPPEDALRECMQRVQAIAAVHDLLSQDEDVRVVDARPVIERLVPMILRSAMPSTDVDVRMDVSSVPLSSKRATALALILNELVSNAAKHALRNGTPPALGVSLRQESEELVLRITDNGPGLADDFNLVKDSHVGLDVVRILAERDLQGTFSITDTGRSRAASSPSPLSHGVTAEVHFLW